MRPCLCCTVMIVALAVGVCRAPASSRAPRVTIATTEASKAPPRMPAPPIATWTVEGFGTNVPRAEQNALDSAVDGMSAWLASNRADLEWTPSAAYLRDHGIVKREGEPESVDLPKSGPMQRVVLRVELLAQHLEELETSARLARARQRQTALAQGLSAIVGLLVVSTGLMKLQEKVALKPRLFTALAVTVVLALAAGFVVAMNGMTLVPSLSW